MTPKIGTRSSVDFDFGFIDNVGQERHPAQQAVLDLMDAIEPLLKNLEKDSEKNAYIHWPNRKEKIVEFREKLQKIADRAGPF